MNQNIIENSLINLAATDSEARLMICSKLTAENFVGYARDVFKKIHEYDLNNQSIDFNLLESIFDESEESTDVLHDAKLLVPSINVLDSYIKQLIDKTVKRKLFGLQTSISTILSNDTDGNDMLSDVQRKLDLIGDNQFDDNVSSMSNHLPQYLTGLKKAAENEGHIVGIETGLREIDKMLSGLIPTDLIIVAGRPAMGKTTFAMSLVEKPLENDHVGLFFSLEMPANQILGRFISSYGQIDNTKLKQGNLSEKDRASLKVATDFIVNNDNFYIDDRGGITLSEMKRKAHMVKKQAGKLDFILIDYLQLMGTQDVKRSTRSEELGAITGGLKALGKELNIPIILLSQLSRDLEKRADKRPLPSDLRESGAIEQDADIIIFIYRDEVYNKETKDKGIGEAIIGKHRNGDTGVVKLKFEGRYTKFSNLPMNS
jgi:replicative DNA helicase